MSKRSYLSRLVFGARAARGHIYHRFAKMGGGKSAFGPAVIEACESRMMLAASTLYWDAPNLQAGSATWSTTAANWNTQPDGSGSVVPWTNGDDAVICTGGNATITVSGNVTADSITFGAVGYTIAGSAITLSAPTSPITGNQAATITNDIVGNPIFNGSISFNGTITGNATFNDDSANNGNVTGDGIFNDSSSNNGNVTGNATFNDSSDNYGGIGGDATFNDQSWNYSTISGDATFNGSSYNYIPGNVNGDAVFNDSSSNWGTIGGNATFNDGTYDEEGIISGNATFNDSSSNYWGGHVNGNAIFNGGCNEGTVNGDAIFYGGTSNQGSVYGDAIFNDDSNNQGGCGVAIFNDNSYNDYTLNTWYMLNKLRRSQLSLSNVHTSNDYYDNSIGIGDATFNDNSYNDGTVGEATFNDNSVNWLTINDDANFNNDSVNWGMIGGDATFSDYSYNVGFVTGYAGFSDHSYNEGTISWGASFADYSYNDGTVSGGADFYDSAYNAGMVILSNFDLSGVTLTGGCYQIPSGVTATNNGGLVINNATLENYGTIYWQTSDLSQLANISNSGTIVYNYPGAISITGQTIVISPGQSYTGELADFTDNAPDAWSDPSLYWVSINGDYNIPMEAIAPDGSGGFTVSGEIIYYSPGLYTVTIGVSGPDNRSASITDSVYVTTLTATGQTFTAVQGQAYSGNVATFTDAISGTPASNYTASIDWGDGSTTSPLDGSAVAITSDGHGNFTVSGNHTYTQAGTFYPQVTITEGDVTTSASAEADVSGFAISPQAINATLPSGNFSGTVATFTDNGVDASDVNSDYSATINWGDGNTSPQDGQAVVVAYDSNNDDFTITGNHTYLSAGTPTVTITVTGPDSRSAVSSGTVADVTNLTVTAETFPALQGQSFTGPVATFTDASGNTNPNQYTASIDWLGDGSDVTTGSITYANGIFTITGNQTFTSAGTCYPVVTITDNSNQSYATAFDEADVTGFAISPQPISATLWDGTFSGIAATFTDDGVGATTNPADYTATIDWGDGSRDSSQNGSAVVIAYDSTNDDFTITGTHNYWWAGTPTVMITVTGPDSRTGSATESGNVTSLTITGETFSAAQGQDFAGEVATFTDIYGTYDPTIYTATIDWLGDGSDITTGNVYCTGYGSFAVAGNSTFTSAGTFNPVITIVDANTGNSTATALSIGNVTGIIATAASSVSANEGQPTGDVVLATFTNTSSNTSGDSYTASIDWLGDGTDVGTGTVTYIGGGNYTVTGNNTFASSGTFNPVVTITDTTNPANEFTGTASAEVDVAGPSDVSIAGDSTAQEGSPYTLVLSAPEVGANTITGWTINWGDGSGNQTVGIDPTTGTVPDSVDHIFATGVASASITATATDQGGTYAADAPVAVTVVPAAPDNVLAQWNEDGTVSLSWTEQSALATSFVIGESTDGGNTFTTLATIYAGNTTYAVSNPAAGASFAVAAADATGASDMASETLNASDLTLTATVNSSSAINVFYTSTCPAGTNYLLEWKTPLDTNFHSFTFDDNTTGSGTIADPWVVGNLISCGNYSFRLRADLDGNAVYVDGNATISDPSNPAFPVPTFGSQGQDITVTMPSQEDIPAGYSLFCLSIQFCTPDCTGYTGWFPDDDVDGGQVYASDGLSPGQTIVVSNYGEGWADMQYRASLTYEDTSADYVSCASSISGQVTNPDCSGSAPQAGNGGLTVTPNLDGNGTPDGTYDISWTGSGSLIINSDSGPNLGPDGSYITTLNTDDSLDSFSPPRAFVAARIVDPASQQNPSGSESPYGVIIPPAAAYPNAPSNLSATLGNQPNQVNLLWNDNSNNEMSFIVEEKLDSDPNSADWMQVGSALSADTETDTLTLPSNNHVYDLAVLASNAAGNSTAATTKVSGVALRSVTFGGSASQTIERDNGSGPYTGPQWFDGNLNGKIDPGSFKPFSNGTIDNQANPSDLELDYPVSYIRSSSNSSTYITATVSLPYVGAAGANWEMEADASGYIFPAVHVTDSGGNLTATLTAQQAIPEAIRDTEVDIVWKLSTNGGASFFKVGESENRVYVTGGSANGAYETELDIGCAAADKVNMRDDPNNPGQALQADQRTAVDHIFSKFESLNIKRVDGTVMLYNHQPGFGGNAPQMLAQPQGRGQCTAWADLLVQVLRCQGIAATPVDIDPPGAAARFAVKLMPAQGNASYTTGTQARGGFNFHQVVAIGVYPNEIFDPSYGGLTVGTSAVDVEEKYETNNITAFLEGTWVPDQHVYTGSPLVVFSPSLAWLWSP